MLNPEQRRLFHKSLSKNGSSIISDVHIAIAGNDVVLRYANMALKTQVEKLLISHLNNQQAIE
ncbi:hypothetical protein SAMN02787108_03027 [Lysinibacillus fusiformis]|nr:hypothetical protein [Lysinibacillus fusiformis]SCX62126.1 hypothetical protein SAMN02787108_03027 [Lysinibacillus fusiformis]SDB44225.1 hypothetical protein SAMN02787070_03268 [Lysinibacillus fusiformis]SFI65894.1 hypothetical protein SAMN02787080_03285 [Lysinibacillus fusiformis]SFT12196.1 hypothetical protein SAMN02787099_02942 [Lysinibacillus fusiformis]